MMISEEKGYNLTNHSWHYPFLKFQTASLLVHQKWTTGTVYGLVGAMLAAVVAAVTYECIHEYLRYLRHRALTRARGSECCGTIVFTCWEKLIQSIVQMFRVTIGYFMMLCVMTMNTWILVAVVVGAAIGFGVGKPLVANAIRDIVTSHGYNVARVDHSTSTSTSHQASQRSSSWRYQPISVNEQPDERLMEILASIEKHADMKKGDNYQNPKTNDNCVEVIWIRRSFVEQESDSQSLDVFSSESDVENIKSEVQVRHISNQKPSTSKYPDNTSPSLNLSSRFRSTSKTINDSFRSEGDGSIPSMSRLNSSLRSDLNRHDIFRSDSNRDDSFRSDSNRDDSFRTVTIRSDSHSIDYDSIERRKKSKNKRTTSKSLDRGSSTTLSRFKPISKQISRQQSFNTSSFEIG